MTIEDIQQQRRVCEDERLTALKTGKETMAAWYKCRITELEAQERAAKTNGDETNGTRHD